MNIQNSFVKIIIIFIVTGVFMSVEGKIQPYRGNHSSSIQGEKKSMPVIKIKNIASEMKWNNIGKNLNSKDSLLRMAAAWKLAVDQPEQHTSDLVLSFIAEALNSNYPLVREYGSYAAARVSFAHHPRAYRNRGLSTPYDLSTRPEILHGLVNMLNDKNVQARVSAFKAIMLSYDPMPMLKPKLLQQFQESTSSKEKGAILELMTSWNYSGEKVVNTMVNALESKSRYVQAKAASSIGKLGFSEAIVPLVRAYFISSDNVKKYILRALRRYHNKKKSELTKYHIVTREVEILLDNMMQRKKSYSNLSSEVTITGKNTHFSGNLYLSLNQAKEQNEIFLLNIKNAARTMKWDHIGENLKSTDELLRRGAAWKLAIDTPEQHNPKRVLSFIAIALNSVDPLVREYGADAAYRVAGAYYSNAIPNSDPSTPYNLSNNPQILKGLKAVLNNKSVKARVSAVYALALGYDSILSLKPILLNKLTRSQSASLKGAIIEAMSIWNYSGKNVVKAIINELGEKSKYVQIKAVNAIGKLLPSKAIVPLVRAYFIAPDKVKEYILKALDQYHNKKGSILKRYQEITEDVKTLLDYMKPLQER